MPQESGSFLELWGARLTVAFRESYKSFPTEKFLQAEPGMN